MYVSLISFRCGQGQEANKDQEATWCKHVVTRSTIPEPIVEHHKLDYTYEGTRFLRLELYVDGSMMQYSNKYQAAF